HGRRGARSLVIAVMLLVAAAGGGFAQEQAASAPLTVEQALNLAVSNQPLIQQAQAAVQAAQSRVGQAQSSYYPNLSGTFSYMRVEPDQSFAFDFPPLPPLSFSLLPVDNWDFHLGLNQIIYQFGKRGVQVRLAENGVAAARIGVEQIRTSLVFQTAQLFYASLFLREQVRALDSQLENLQQHLAGIQVREQTGSATQFEVLSTQVKIASLQSQRTEAENQYSKQRIALLQMVGMDPSSEIALSGEFAEGAEPADVQTFIADATANRAEIRQAIEAEEAADLNRTLSASSGLPTLSARGTLGYKNAELPDINAMTFNWTAGLLLNVPLFQGFYTARQIEEGQQRLAAAKANTAAVRRTLTTQVLQAYQDLMSARQQVVIAGTGLDQAGRMVEVAKVQYDIGVITNLEYLDSQTALLLAQLTRLSASYREVLSEYALQQAAGRLPVALGALPAGSH
ncbi:MAG: TolC family protein, partial [Spirochaetia bacterium]